MAKDMSRRVHKEYHATVGRFADGPAEVGCFTPPPTPARRMHHANGHDFS